MATIKSYTDLQQSKKLAEILPLESADMYYFLDPTPVGNIYIPSLMIIEKHLKSRMPEYDKGDIPCWSLAALLNILPKEINVLRTVYSINIQTKNTKWFIDYKCNNEEFVGAYSNIFVDACYELILKLHELKML